MERVYSAFFEKENKTLSSIPVSSTRQRSTAVSFRKPQQNADSTCHQSNLELESNLLQRKPSKELLNALNAGIRAFAFAYGAKAVTAILLASRRWNSVEHGFADALRLFLKKDTLRFGLFVGNMVGVYRAAEILIQVYRGKADKTNCAIAGALAGLTMFIDTKNRRQVIALYIFVRSLDVLGRHLTAINIIPKWKYTSEVLFSASNGPIMYAFLLEPHLLPSSYYKWILHVGNITHGGLELAIRKRWYLGNDYKTVPFVSCQPHYHIESCVTHNVLDWFVGITRAAKIYLPVHLIPLIVFRYKNILKSPGRTLYNTASAVLFSSCFLTSYSVIMKSIQCILRNAFQRDFGWHGFVGGVGTALGLFFEHHKRRQELMLYCAVRSFDVCWKILKRQGLVKSVKYGEVLLFCFSLSVIMSTPRQHFKGTYRRIIDFIFSTV